MEFSVQQIAALANGIVEGDGNIKINTIAKIEEGMPGAISFLANPKYEPYIYTTKSSAVLVSKEFKPERPLECSLIRVDDPYATVAHLLAMVDQLTRPQLIGIEEPSYIAEGVDIDKATCYVGAFAYIGKGARIGKNVKIYPQVYVGPGCEISDDTVLYPGVKIYHGCKIGNRCIIHSGAVIGADGFGFAPTPDGYDKIPQTGIVEIANDVEIGANTTVDRAVMGATVIERGVKLDNLIQIAHNCRIGANTVMAAQAGVAGSAKVGEWCMVGGQVGLAGHITVGDRAQFAAQSGVHKNVAAGARLFGSPAITMRDYGRRTRNVQNLDQLYAEVSELKSQIEKLQQK